MWSDVESPSVVSCRSCKVWILENFGFQLQPRSLLRFWVTLGCWISWYPLCSETFFVGSSSLKHRTTYASPQLQNWAHMGSFSAALTWHRMCYVGRAENHPGEQMCPRTRVKFALTKTEAGEPLLAVPPGTSHQTSLSPWLHVCQQGCANEI